MQPFPDDWTTAMAIVAHPDDVEYGAAGAVAAWTAQGRSVSYLMVTRGEAGIDGLPPEEAGPLREREQRAAGQIVGAAEVEFLDHADGTIEYGLPLRRDIAAAIRRHRPEVVVTMNHELFWFGVGLNMADHRHVGLAVLDAVRDAANRWVFPELLKAGLEPWHGVRWVAINGAGEPTHFVDVTESIAAGVESLRAHAQYLAHLGDSPMTNADTFLRMSAAASGELCGCDYAVTFRLVAM